MLHKEIPFIRLLVPLCIGILFGYLTDIPEYGAISLLVSAALVLFSSLFFKTLLRNYLYGAALSLLLASSGFLLLRHELAIPDTLNNTESLFVCTIKSFPEAKTNSFAVMTDLQWEILDDTIYKEVKGGLLIYHSTFNSVPPLWVPGDIIIVRTRPVPITNRGNPFEFDYRSFMQKKGVGYFAFTNQKVLISHTITKKRSVREKALIAGKRISAFYAESGISKKNASLLSALTLGQKESIDDETRTNFSRAGVMHVMAVSGLHAGIISMFVFSLLFFLKGRLKVLRVIISVGVLWTFAFITGLAPSVERAAIMFTFLHLGKLLKRPVNSINSILAAAFFMLLINPSNLTSLGFQLSFSAVLFISGFYSSFSRLISTGIWPIDKTWQLCAVSILAQLGTMPFTMNAFGQFPVWFLPANIIIIPLASAILILAFILIILSPVNFFTGIIAKVLNVLLSTASSSAAFITGLPGSSGIGKVLPWPETICLFLVILTLLYYVLIMEPKSMKLFLAATIMYISVTTVRHLQVAGSTEIIIYNSMNQVAVGLRSGHSLYLYSENEETDQSIIRHASALSLNIEKHQVKQLPFFVEFMGEQIIISENFPNPQIADITADILITKRVPAILNRSVITENMSLVVTSGSFGVIILTEDDRLSGDSNIHFIPDSGALRINTGSGRRKRGRNS